MISWPRTAKLCKILQKLFPTFLWASSRTKGSSVSWWQARDGHHSRKFAKMNFNFLVSVKECENKRGVMMAKSRWAPFAKFCKNKFRLFCKRQAGRKKRGLLMANLRWPPFAKFCKNEFRLFSKRQAGRKKARCHDGELPMATLREISQQRISTLLQASSNAKTSAVSWWQSHDGHHLLNFAKINFDSFVSVKQNK